MGKQIPCNANCGIFITMNPGYAGTSANWIRLVYFSFFRSLIARCFP
jgi:hypothetical protein